MTKQIIKNISKLTLIACIFISNSLPVYAQVVGQAQADKIQTAFISTVVYWGNIIGLIVITFIIVKEIYQSAFAKSKNDLVGDILKQVGVVIIILALLNLVGNSSLANQLVHTIKGLLQQLVNSII